ncbi:Acid phosphatase 1, partial [Linum grandiflorum]
AFPSSVLNKKRKKEKQNRKIRTFRSPPYRHPSLPISNNLAGNPIGNQRSESDQKNPRDHSLVSFPLNVTMALAPAVPGLILISVLCLFNLVSASQSLIRMPGFRTTTGTENFCNGWRLSVETNNAGAWLTPEECLGYRVDYFTGVQYAWDLAVVVSNSVAFAKSVKLAGDGKDAWVFDVDETLLSNLPFYEKFGYSADSFNEEAWNEWVNSTGAPALSESLGLYKELKELGFTIFILTGRDETQRNATTSNLISAGFRHWQKLILRGDSDKGKPALVYKSEKREEIVKQGYRIQGNSGDQWSDLLGQAVGLRSFKYPNPLYYLP